MSETLTVYTCLDDVTGLFVTVGLSKQFETLSESDSAKAVILSDVTMKWSHNKKIQTCWLSIVVLKQRVV